MGRTTVKESPEFDASQPRLTRPPENSACRNGKQHYAEYSEKGTSHNVPRFWSSDYVLDVSFLQAD